MLEVAFILRSLSDALQAAAFDGHSLPPETVIEIAAMLASLAVLSGHHQVADPATNIIQFDFVNRRPTGGDAA